MVSELALNAAGLSIVRRLRRFVKKERALSVARVGPCRSTEPKILSMEPLIAVYGTKSECKSTSSK